MLYRCPGNACYAKQSFKGTEDTYRKAVENAADQIRNSMFKTWSGSVKAIGDSLKLWNGNINEPLGHPHYCYFEAFKVQRHR